MGLGQVIARRSGIYEGRSEVDSSAKRFVKNLKGDGKC